MQNLTKFEHQLQVILFSAIWSSKRQCDVKWLTSSDYQLGYWTVPSSIGLCDVVFISVVSVSVLCNVVITVWYSEYWINRSCKISVSPIWTWTLCKLLHRKDIVHSKKRDALMSITHAVFKLLIININIGTSNNFWHIIQVEKLLRGFITRSPSLFQSLFSTLFRTL